MAFWKDDTSFKIKKDRRQPMSKLKKKKIVVSILSWFFIFISFIAFDATLPSTFNIDLLDKKYGKTTEFIPNIPLVKVALAFSICAIILSASNTYLMFKYNRRKDDKINKLTLSSLALSILLSILFIRYLI